MSVECGSRHFHVAVSTENFPTTPDCRSLSRARTTDRSFHNRSSLNGTTRFPFVCLSVLCPFIERIRSNDKPVFCYCNSCAASLEPSEVEVRSISLIISKTHFFHCFLFLPGILHLFYSFSKTFLQKLSLPFFNNLKKQTTFLLFLLKFKGSIPKSPHTASLQVFEEQPKIFLHAANNTASNALDWDVVHLHTSLPYRICWY